MPHIFVVFGGVCMVIFMMLACDDVDPKRTEAAVKHMDCYMIPESKKDQVADLIVQCVNNATAKQTGENQDADDWVEACGDEFKNLYQVHGYREYTGYAGDPEYLSACKEYPKDSALTTPK